MMKKPITVVTILLSLFLGFPVIAGQQTGGMRGMMNNQSGMMNSCQMSTEQSQKMRTAMEAMRATRQRMLAAKNPAEKKQLMQQHLREMETCMKMMPMTGQRSCRHQKGQMMGNDSSGLINNHQGMNASGKMMSGHGRQKMRGGYPCRQLMREMMASMKAQMEMMNQ